MPRQDKQLQYVDINSKANTTNVGGAINRIINATPNLPDEQTPEPGGAQPDNPPSNPQSTIEASVGNNYSDIAGNKQSYTPNSGLDKNGNPLVGGGKNTGSGAEAAVGTNYTWNQSANNKAQSTYQTDVLTTKQNFLNNRQTIENNAVNYQTQADMMKYQNNQNAEKVGWTGGYVLDQNRQMEYLKSSIQAQMYGAMELQKYGYDSSLAAARLSYDLNQQEYARQYYQEAVSAALSEAQLTGTYFSAETKDMMSQLAVARQKQKDQSLSQEERDQAIQLEAQIENWFQTNGISKEGVRTLEAWQQDQANELQWSNELWTRYQAALEAANTDIANNASTFIMLDADGKEMWDGTNVTTGNWDTMNGEQIFNYISNNSAAANQYYSYLDSTVTGTVESGFTKWCQTKKYITTDKDGKTIVNENDYSLLLKDYIEDSGILENFQKKFAGLSETDVYKMIGNWDFTLQLPDGKTLNVTYNNLINGNYGEGGSSKPGETSTVTATGTDNAGNTINYTWLDSTSYILNKQGSLGTSYYTSTLTTGDLKFTSFCVTAANAVTTANKPVSTLEHVAIKIYADDKEDRAGGYEAEIETAKPSITANSASFKELVTYTETLTGKGLQEGQLIVIGGTVYCYHNEPVYDINGGTAGGEGLYRLGGQCGKSTLVQSLKKSGQWVD